MADEHIASGPSQPSAPTETASPGPTEITTPGVGADGVQNGHIAPAPLAPVGAPVTPPRAELPRTDKTDGAPPESKDVFREVAETIVFVVVLVLLLKTFVAEAFVIPTGSMATTLWGYQKYITCPYCRFAFPVNCSSQVDPQSDRPRSIVTGCECPNCRISIDFAAHGIPIDDWHSGDRVLVFKSLYDTPIGTPTRHDVVVFKYPVEPQKNHVAMNYIKRLIGLPGETIAIAQGQLYVHNKPRQVPEPEGKRYWDSPYAGGFPWRGSSDELHKAHADAEKLFQQGEFQIIRKSPALIPALQRIVFDNDFQPNDTTLYPPRWIVSGQWQGDGIHPRRFSQAQPPAALEWLRYRHQLTGGGQPQLITDFMGYNTGDTSSSSNGRYWVGDLILECEAEIDQAAADGELRLELSKGFDRFQARFNLQSGQCTLVRVNEQGEQPLPLKLEPQSPPAAAPTAVKGTGKFQLRFANVDEQLLVWVNDELVFGNGVPYAAAPKQGPTANDLQPASVGAKGASLHVGGLRLWRDTYYTTYNPGVSKHDGGDVSLSGDWLTDPTKWDGKDELRKPTPMIMYVHPGHYLCLGDNSPASADSRSWGLVPERLMLGRALVVYFPFYFPYPPLNSPTNRTGVIR
ncbi:MAG: signal peptidase I [Planctomycetia bacterium]|nr:signal peptidase I [Planctomycetia bacterium]